MIWEPFVLALVLGLVVSAGLYFAYLWPSVEPELTDEPLAAGASTAAAVANIPAAPTPSDPPDNREPDSQKADA